MKKHSREIAVELSNVSKEYIIHHEKPTLVEKFVKGKYEKFFALRNINFTMHAEDRVGIVGPNGSGKTTLMKIIAKICKPTTGEVTSHGKIVTLIELEAGFHSELSGEQNIYLNGMLLGMDKTELKQNLNNIIKYADIKQFIDAPLFTYSSGMKLRLGFSIAIHASPRILILDEGFLVGDTFFRNKIRQTLSSKFNHGEALIISTHSHEILTQICNRIIIMNQGSIVYSGGIEAIRLYDKYVA